MTTSAPALRAAATSCLTYVALERGAADLRGRRVVAAGDRVVGQDRDLGPGGFQDRRLARGLEVLAGAGHLQAALREVRDRLEEAVAARIADVVVRQRDVVHPGVHEPVDQRRLGREDRARWCASSGRSGPGSRSWRWRCRRRSMRSRIAPALPVRFVYGQVPAERRAVLAAPGDLGGAAVEREVRALALDDEGLVDATVEHDVAAGEEGPGRGRVEGGRGLGGRQARVQRSRSARSRTRSTPKRLAVPQARARTDGPTSSARRNARRLRFVARSVLRVAASAASTSRVGSGRPLDPEGRQDRVGLARDELERVVALARPGQHGRDLAAIRGLDRRPELGRPARSATSARTTPGVGEAVGAGVGVTARRRRGAGVALGAVGARRRTGRRRRPMARRRPRSRTRARRPRRARRGRSRGGRGRRAADRVSRAGV